ncbi:MAG TPA: hypothetical protein VJ953_06590 [Saprospiraceae bacterium]|nr:hypothetical protein [Saprospiraceae bacterium]
MNYKRFKIKARYEETKRFRTRFFDEKNEDRLRKKLKDLGYLEPFEIIEIDHDSPTEAQLRYAKKLRIAIPANATKEDLSCLLSRKIDKDTSPNKELIEFAESKKIFFSKYIGKKALYNLIYHSLSEKDKIAFFIFSVYRHLSNDRKGNLLKHPHKKRFYEIAQMVQKNEKVKKSILRYDGEELRFFGTMIASNWLSIDGGSTNTYGYKFVSEILSSEFNVRKTRTLNYGKISSTKQGQGCFSSALVLQLIALMLIIYLSFL